MEKNYYSVHVLTVLYRGDTMLPRAMTVTVCANSNYSTDESLVLTYSTCMHEHTPTPTPTHPHTHTHTPESDPCSS